MKNRNKYLAVWAVICLLVVIIGIALPVTRNCSLGLEGVRVQRQVIERIEEMEKRVNGWLSPEEREWWLRCVNKIETGLKEAEYD